MLVKITNSCAEGCRHCMEKSVPKAPHMTLETFVQTLRFVHEIEALAHADGYRLILLSGGEPSENPQVVEFLHAAVDAGFEPLLLSNGSWLTNEELKARILAVPSLRVQITHDPRFYRTKPPVIDDPRLTYVDSLTSMFPIGRFAGKEHGELPSRQAPTSFNFRSIMRALGDIRETLRVLRGRAMSGSVYGHCSPSITHEGRLVAGESRLCHEIGTIFDSPETITANVLAMGSCDRCGLERGLPPMYRQAIGLE